MNKVYENAFEKAEDSFDDAQLLFSHERYTAAINRCYYSVYYVVNALLLEKEIHVKTHSGIIRKFSEVFIQSGEFPEHLISLYRKIFEKRQIAIMIWNSMLIFMKRKKQLPILVSFWIQ